MARLPVVGADTDSWGPILNGLLEVEHNPDGTLKLKAPHGPNLAPNTFPRWNGSAWAGVLMPIQVFNVQDQAYGAVGDGTTDDTVAIQAAINAAYAAGGGIVFFPEGTYKISSSLQLVGMSNIWVQGSGINATIIVCTNALDGSNATTKNNVFNVNNLTAPVGSYLKNIWISDLTIDASAQSAIGVPPEAVFGHNLCGIEFQNVDNAVAERVRVKGAFGNGIVSASIDPGMEAAVRGAWIQDCIFDGCIRGTLPQYDDITGSVIQLGAMVSGIVRGCHFLDSGGPAIDFFNCKGTIIESNYFSGIGTTPIGTGQRPNSLRSDFGLEECIIRDNIFEEAGHIFLSGSMTPTALTDNVSRPGPNSCKICGNIIRGTGKYAKSPNPAVPASGGTVTNTDNFPNVFTVTGGTGVVVRVGGVIQTPTGANNNGYLVGAGGVVQLDYTSAPTWQWYRAPNANLAHLVILAGNAAAQPLGIAADNLIYGNHFLEPPVDAVQLYDCRYNLFTGNIVRSPGEWTPSAAFQALDTAAVAGTGTRNCTISDNIFTDKRTVKTMQTVYRDGSVNCLDNRMHNNFLDTCTFATPYVLLVAANRFYSRGDYGPGRTSAVLTPPSVPASTVALTNPFSFDVLVCVAGGTVTAIAIAGTSTGLTSGSFVLRQGDSITLTYSVAPTWKWFIAD